MCLLSEEHREASLTHLYCRHKPFSKVMSDLFDVLWFNPNVSSFTCGQGAFLSTMNQSAEPSVHVRQIKSALSQKKILLAALHPVNEEIQLLVKLHQVCDLTICLFELSPDGRARQSVPHHWACSSKANSHFSHLTPFWPGHAARHTSAPAKTDPFFQLKKSLRWGSVPNKSKMHHISNASYIFI